MCISPLILSQWCTNPASDVKTASLECLFLDLLKSLAWYQQSLCTFGCVLRAVILNMITRFYAWLLYQKQTWWEPTAYLGIGKEKYTSPSLFQRCLALSQSAESTAWSCLENLIRSHSAEHIEFQEAGKLLPLEGVWKMVHGRGGEDKNYTEMTKKHINSNYVWFAIKSSLFWMLGRVPPWGVEKCSRPLLNW